MSSSSSPLPIQLISFTATPFGRDVKLAWTTATEINNSFFTVQRSGRGDIFTDVTHVAGAGTSSTINNYVVMDTSPLTGVNYYRLKQTDYDGRTTVSNVQVVNMNRSIPLTVFPNPFRGTQVNVAVGDIDAQDVEVELYDLAGKRISGTIYVSDLGPGGVATLTFDHELACGAYMLEVKTSTGNFHQRLVKE
jgi:hypothetical protein